MGKKNPKKQKKWSLEKQIGQKKPRRVKKWTLEKKSGKKTPKKYNVFMRVTGFWVPKVTTQLMPQWPSALTPELH